MKTALVLDSDLSFAFWLGRGLDEAGYEAFPARSVSDAAALLDELRIMVDLLIFSPSLPGASEFIDAVRRVNDSVIVVALFGDQPRLSGPAAGVDVYCRRPDRLNQFKRLQWIERLQELMPVSVGAVPFPRRATSLGAYTFALAPRQDEGARGETESGGGLKPDWGWTACEGQIIDGRFPLQRFLGKGGSSGVFLTECGGGQPAALKLVPPGWISGWERASAVTHPGLVRLFGMGSCTVEDTALEYVVMEYAEETLAEVLRERPLTPAEARELLEPALGTLAFLHDRGIPHGRLKPSNIMASGDQVKLASDGLFAPASAGSVSPAGDMWSLGVTLIEALTQRAPERRGERVVVPGDLPDEYADLARACLDVRPRRRLTAAGMARRLSQPPPVRKAVVETESAWSRWGYAVLAAALALSVSALLIAPPAHRPATLPTLLAQTARPAPRRIVSRILPDLPAGVRDALEGTVVVHIRARVDASGAVVSAEPESTEPNRYLTRQAVAAAQLWRFEPLSAGQPLDEWKLSFEYTRTATTSQAEPVISAMPK